MAQHTENYTAEGMKFTPPAAIHVETAVTDRG